MSQEIFSKITILKFAASDSGPLHTLTAKYVSSALEHVSNIMAEAYDEMGRDHTVWIIERWEREAEWTAFQETKQAISLFDARTTMDGMVAEEYAVTDLEPLTSSEWRRPADPGDEPFTAVLILRAKTGTQDEFISRYHDAMPKFRSEQGVITYQLTQDKNDETRFLTYEKFRSEAAFQFHLKFPPIDPIVDFLKTSIQDPPFEKGLHKLVRFYPNDPE